MVEITNKKSEIMTTNQMIQEVKKVVGSDVNDNLIIDTIIDFDNQGMTDENIVKYVIDEILNS